MDVDYKFWIPLVVSILEVVLMVRFERARLGTKSIAGVQAWWVRYRLALVLVGLSIVAWTPFFLSRVLDKPEVVAAFLTNPGLTTNRFMNDRHAIVAMIAVTNQGPPTKLRWSASLLPIAMSEGIQCDVQSEAPLDAPPFDESKYEGRPPYISGTDRELLPRVTLRAMRTHGAGAGFFVCLLPLGTPPTEAINRRLEITYEDDSGRKGVLPFDFRRPPPLRR